MKVSQRQQDVQQVINTQNIQNFYNVKHHKHFIKQYYGSSLHHLLRNTELTCWCTLVSDSSSRVSLLNHVSVGSGNATYGTWIEKSSPARTVMSRIPPWSMHRLLGYSSIKMLLLGLLGSDGPTFFTAITLNWYSSPFFKLGTCECDEFDFTYLK